jgi:hypothetical protein
MRRIARHVVRRSLHDRDHDARLDRPEDARAWQLGVDQLAAEDSEAGCGCAYPDSVPEAVVGWHAQRH